MSQEFKGPLIAPTAVWLLIPSVFILDIFRPEYFAAWTLYMVPIFLTIWISRRSTYITGVIVTILIIVGLFFSPTFAPLFSPLKFIYILNRVTAILLVWMMVYLIASKIAWKEKVLNSHALLEESVKQQTRNLEVAKNSLENSLQSYIAESEKMNELMFDRELKILELKKED